MSVPVLISAVSVIFCIGAFAYFRSYINQRTSRDAVLAEIREEINRLLIRMDETTNRDISLIEDKEQSLKALLEETEKRLKVYARELDRSLVNERIYRDLGRSKQLLAESVKPEEEVHTASEQNLPGNKNVSGESSGPEGGTKAPASPGEQIRRLAAAGFSAAVIASKLGISISEVELALAVLASDRRLVVESFGFGSPSEGLDREPLA